MSLENHIVLAKRETSKIVINKYYSINEGKHNTI